MSDSTFIKMPWVPSLGAIDLTGMGLAVAQAVGREGMNVVIADISRDTLAIAEASLSEQGNYVLALTAGA